MLSYSYIEQYANSVILIFTVAVRNCYSNHYSVQKIFKTKAFKPIIVLQKYNSITFGNLRIVLFYGYEFEMDHHAALRKNI